MHSLGSKKLSYNFVCKKLSHLGTICSTGLFYLHRNKGEKPDCLCSPAVLKINIQRCQCNCVLKLLHTCCFFSVFQWVYFGLLFQIVVLCELARKLLKLQQFLVILLEQWLAWQLYLICALLFRIGSVSAEPLPASHVNTGGQIVRLILLVTASGCSRVNFLGVLFWFCYFFFFLSYSFMNCNREENISMSQHTSVHYEWANRIPIP